MWTSEASAIFVVVVLHKHCGKDGLDNWECFVYTRDMRINYLDLIFLNLYGGAWAWTIDEKRVIYLRFELMQISSIINKERNLMNYVVINYLLYINTCVAI